MATLARTQSLPVHCRGKATLKSDQTQRKMIHSSIVHDHPSNSMTLTAIRGRRPTRNQIARAVASQAYRARPSQASRRRAVLAAVSICQAPATSGSHSNSRVRTGTSSSLSKNSRWSTGTEVTAPRDDIAGQGPRESVQVKTVHSIRYRRKSVWVSTHRRQWDAPDPAQETAAQQVHKATDQTPTPQDGIGPRCRSAGIRSQQVARSPTSSTSARPLLVLPLTAAQPAALTQGKEVQQRPTWPPRQSPQSQAPSVISLPCQITLSDRARQAALCRRAR